MTFNQGVPGSIPGWVTIIVKRQSYMFAALQIYAPVAQLDRAIASDAMCHAFESHRAYQKLPRFFVRAFIFYLLFESSDEPNFSIRIEAKTPNNINTNPYPVCRLNPKPSGKIA